MSHMTKLTGLMDSIQDVKNEQSLALYRIEQHPFNLHATRHSVQIGYRWLKCAGRESRTFPVILQQMLDHCSDEHIRKILRENLDDEHGNGNPEHAHFRHYLHLLDKLNIQQSDFETYEEKSGIKLAVDLALSISANPNLPRALGYMLVNEGMTPITYSAARSVLTRHHPELKTSFFDMHIDVDKKHVDELYRAISALPDETLDDVLFGIAIGERGMAVLLDEVIGVFDAT